MGVVVIFMNAGFGGSIQPRRRRKRGWLPKGIIDSITQKMALLCRSRYSLGTLGDRSYFGLELGIYFDMPPAIFMSSSKD